MTKEISLSLMTLAFLGCSTVSQNEVFDGVKREASVRGIENLQWIKTQEEADSVNESVNALLSTPLTQDNAVRIALINNRLLQQTYEEIGISQSELVQAGLMSNPLLGYSCRTRWWDNDFYMESRCGIFGFVVDTISS